MVELSTTSASGAEEASLPAALLKEALLNPYSLVAERARGRLQAALPALKSEVASFPLAVFGLTGGFFYLTAAQGRAWGMSDRLVADVLTIQAMGHFHFAFHDIVIDEGQGPAVMCLLSDVSLLRYLDGLAAFKTSPTVSYADLHSYYYDLYAGAIRRDLVHRERLHPYSADDLLGLGEKAAPGATMFHLVADLADRPALAEPTVRAMLRLCTGLQLLDDLHDCADDAAAGNLTWPVTSAMMAYPGLDTADDRTIMAAVVGCGAAGSCLRLAAEVFTDSVRLAEHAKASVLADLARAWSQRATDRASRLSEALQSAGMPTGNLGRET